MGSDSRALTISAHKFTETVQEPSFLVLCLKSNSTTGNHWPDYTTRAVLPSLRTLFNSINPGLEMNCLSIDRSWLGGDRLLGLLLWSGEQVIGFPRAISDHVHGNLLKALASPNA
ncbi:hypothetical protein CASFOL_036670 [Castilleja foliolosa]|uniref:Uncharacterized protein n=1 Tax=Castilleja foliolosa TaxID=1961234 RepID=A0ABD3BNU1_9LAMI